MSQCGDMFVSLSVSGVEIICSGKRIKGIIPMFQVSLRNSPKIEKENVEFSCLREDKKELKLCNTGCSMHAVEHIYLTVNRTKERAYKSFTGSHFSPPEPIYHRN